MNNEDIFNYKKIQNFGIHNFKCLVKLFNGNFNANIDEEEKGRICIELPFANCDSSNEIFSIAKLNIYEQRQVDKCTISWCQRISHNPETKSFDHVITPIVSRNDICDLKHEKLKSSAKLIRVEFNSEIPIN